MPVPDHPDHPPLDYQELLGLEDMGEPSVTIGKLRLRLNLRQLLDGYEPIEVRQRRDLKQMGIDFEERDGRPGIQVNIRQDNSATHQHGAGDNFGGDRVAGKKGSGVA
ncbi:hypothetical protein [Leptolyngbya sp. PCC 6406]|uniref:hypothetical protein n=1 Tax=Leptolyngbya sp. PCC 6406 TaxID=1173264 RepID=UPI0002ABE0CF|nr:hypothetical protein [Leptolyngbya sp. PCC 6406]